MQLESAEEWIARNAVDLEHLVERDLSGSPVTAALLKDLHRRVSALEGAAPELLFHGADCPGHTTGLPGDSCSTTEPAPAE